MEPATFYGFNAETWVGLVTAMLAALAVVMAAKQKRRRRSELGDDPEWKPEGFDYENSIHAGYPWQTGARISSLQKPPPVRFIILSAARTGSNLLRHLLGSHPDIFAGGELFNADLAKQGTIPWYEVGARAPEQEQINSDEELNRLRQADPGRFIEELISITQDEGYRAIGFKCMYLFPSPEDAAGRYLIADKDIRVIHLKRRNLLRRLLSFERALATDIWYRQRGSEAPELPAITLPIEKVIEDISRTEAWQKEYDERFKEHPLLEIFYEDLAENPQAIAARALNFLGMKASDELAVSLEKTGTDSLRAALKNYDELKSSLVRWAAFFED
jgi:LPS sulfotransferase NodH